MLAYRLPSAARVQQGEARDRPLSAGYIRANRVVFATADHTVAIGTLFGVPLPIETCLLRAVASAPAKYGQRSCYRLHLRQSNAATVRIDPIDLVRRRLALSSQSRPGPTGSDHRADSKRTDPTTEVERRRTLSPALLRLVDRAVAAEPLERVRHDVPRLI